MSKPWKVPADLFCGKTVAVLASGPSMSSRVAFTACFRYASVAVNNTWELCPRGALDLIVARDLAWWKAFKNPAQIMKSTSVHVGTVACALPIATLRETGEEGFDPDPGNVRTGGNSGHTGVYIAAAGNPDKIILLGFDMRPSESGALHWHKDHAHPMGNPTADSFALWRSRLERFAALLLKERGIPVVCGTPSALQLPYEPLIKDQTKADDAQIEGDTSTFPFAPAIDD